MKTFFLWDKDASRGDVVLPYPTPIFCSSTCIELDLETEDASEALKQRVKRLSKALVIEQEPSGRPSSFGKSQMNPSNRKAAQLELNLNSELPRLVHMKKIVACDVRFAGRLNAIV